MTDSAYGQGAIDILDILGIDYEGVVGDLMNKLLLTQESASSQIGVLQSELSRVIADHKNHLEIIDEVCASATITAKCRSCDSYYQIDYDISNYDPDVSYCGRSEWCTP